jgi:hypothetical protein
MPTTDPKAPETFLCRAWGETDLPAAELVSGWEGVRRFMVREWLGAEDATDYDGTVTLDRLKTDYDEHVEDERGSLYEIEFEIGGVSIERVYASGAAPIDRLGQAISDALDEAPAADVLIVITGAFVGLTVEMVRRAGHDVDKAITVDGGKQRDITIHAPKP